MRKRLSFVILFLLSLQVAPLAKPARNIKISPIILQWKAEQNRFNAFFKVDNNTDADVKLSNIIIFKQNRYKKWRGLGTKLPLIKRHHSAPFMLSFPPNILLKSDYVDISINLYRDDYSGRLDRSSRHSTIRSSRRITKKKLIIEFIESSKQKANGAASSRKTVFSVGKPSDLDHIMGTYTNQSVTLKTFSPQGPFHLKDIAKAALFDREVPQIKIMKINSKITLDPPLVSVEERKGGNFLSWKAVEKATSYSIYWSDSQPVTPKTGRRINTRKLSFFHTHLNTSRIYHYVVTSRRKKEESEPSWQVSASPYAKPGSLSDIEGDPVADILIYSPSHASGSSETNKEGVLKIGVNTFSPVQSVTVNNKPYILSGDTEGVISVPYHLKKGKNSFTVTVRTEKASQTKKMFLIYSPNPPFYKNLKHRFGLIALVGLLRESNVKRVPDTYETHSGTKLRLIAIPSYRRNLSRGSAVDLQAIVSREKFGDSRLKSDEVQLTQLKGAWKKRIPSIGDISIGAGANSMGSENSSVINAKYHTQTDLFLFGSLYHPFGNYRSTVQLTLKDKNVQETPDNQNYNEDASIQRLSLKVTRLFSPRIRGTTSLRITRTDAVGKYEDSTQWKIGIRAKYITPAFKLSGQVNQYRVTRSENDPRLNATLRTNRTKIGIKCLFPVNTSLFAQAELEHESQSSNVDIKTFNDTAIGASIIYMFH